MTVTDEQDGKVYALTGNTAGAKPGDRMKLQGRRLKPNGPDKTRIWEMKEVVEDLGLCHP